ncbi:hypothetical protein [Aeromicrobium sp. HA]|uniref:hypothetical protein n=1 Tax=Aeromicrobium sp. HA TaxID=3009077 RepID=UPI0022AE5F63|nr:hypothetical protein [Aeromicrobium sp. HA]
MDVIPWQALSAAGGGWALAGFCVFSMFRGWLVPKILVDDIRADRDTWRSTALETKEVLTKVVDGQEVTNHLLRSLPGMEDKP